MVTISPPVADITLNGHIYTNAQWEADPAGTISGIGNDIDALVSIFTGLGGMAFYGGTSTGSANAQVIAPSVSIPAAATGQAFYFKAGFTNTGAMTLQVNGRAARDVRKGPASASLISGEVRAGSMCAVIDDGTYYQLVFPLDLGPSITLRPGATLDPVLDITRTITSPGGSQRSLMNMLAYGKGDNATVEGVLCLYALARDEASVVAGTKGTLYGVDANVYPIADRNNPPYDDAVCLIASNVGTNLATSGLYIGHGRQGGGADFNACIECEGWGTWGILFDGTYSGYGIDFKYGSYTTNAVMRLKNGTEITGRKADDTTDLRIVDIDSSNKIHVAEAIICNTDGSVDVLGNCAPTSDNAWTSGKSTARWSAVWAANGTIQTSDPTLKTDIADLPSALPIVLALSPKTFRWKIGGLEPKQVAVEEEVPVTKPVNRVEFVTEERGGKFVRVRKEVTRDEPVIDLLPLLDEHGHQVTKPIAAKITKDQDGNDVTVPARDEPQWHARVRTEKRLVMREEMAPREGRRTHWGFLAGDVKAALDKYGAGRDFGGYVKAEDGTEHLRPDQLVPIAIKAIQELHARVAQLEAAR